MAISAIGGSSQSTSQVSTGSSVDSQILQLLSQKGEIQNQINQAESNKKLSDTEKASTIKDLKKQLVSIESQITKLQSQKSNAAKSNTEKISDKKNGTKDQELAFVTGKGVDIDENV